MRCELCISADGCGDTCKEYMTSMCTGPIRPTKNPAKTVDEIREGGIKADNGKNRLDLLPIGPLEDIAEILTFGANKYADHNWRKGFKWSRLLGALLRHTFAWARGEKCDPETGKSHLAHAGCCILFLLEHEKRGLGEDDRYVG